ncbi:MAG: DNA polymerase I [Candidatus Egerieousia sp.]|nr:DNA polymerase I [Candidatus Egerieousia sp.]
MEKVFLIDGHAQIFRMYYAYMRRPLVNSKGEETSILFGFTKMLLDLIKRECPTHLAVAFDPPVKTFRHEAYPLYKANRTAAPEQVIAALEPLKAILEAFGIPVIMVPSYEADDVIGSMATQWSDSSSREIYMVTPDKDYGQVVAQNVFQYKPAKGSQEMEILGPDAICGQYGISSPEQVREILTLWGDSSDNVPGAKGVGEVSAKKLVGKYGTIENIYHHLEELTPKLRASLEEFRPQMPMSRFLVTIKRDVQLPCTLNDIALKSPVLGKIEPLFRRYEFDSLLKLLPDAFAGTVAPLTSAAVTAPAVQAAPTAAQGPTAQAAATEAAPAAAAAPDYIFERIATEELLQKAKASGVIALMIREGEHFWATQELPHKFLWCAAGRLAELSAREFGLYRELLSNAQVKKCGYGLKEMMKEMLQLLQQRGVEGGPAAESEPAGAVRQGAGNEPADAARPGAVVAGPLEDLEIMHYILNPERTHKEDLLLRSYLNISLEELLLKYEKQQGLGQQAPVQQNLFDALEEMGDNAGANGGSNLSEREVARAAIECALQMPLGDAIGKELERNGQWGLYEKIEMPLIEVLATMEHNGVKVDVGQLRSYSARLSLELAEIEGKVRELSGVDGVNLSSPKQVGALLFERLRIAPNIKKSAKGSYPTDEETLNSYREATPVVGLILEYRAVKKLISTYADALPNLISPLDGKVHTTFNQALTATGRLSSNNPNLQNIPIRTERGREIRKAFVPSNPQGFILSADYSQIELRLMAHMSCDPHFLEAFRNGADIHTATAAKIFGVAPEQVSKEERSRAKVANFGIIYGISAFGLSQRMGLSRRDSKEFIETYFATYPGIKEYMEKTIAQGREQGYVETIFGRKRYLPDINSRNANLRSFNERNAINAPLQGSAADIIKIAMINLHRRMQEMRLKSKLILQVHDELVLDVVPEELELLSGLVKETMESVVELKVPLIAECGYGKNWLEAH